MIVSCIYPPYRPPLGDNRIEENGRVAIGAIDRTVINCLSMDATLWHTMALKAPIGSVLHPVPRAPAVDPKFHAVSFLRFFSLENEMRKCVCA